MQDLKIYHLINCGLLIKYRNNCILIDGLNGPSDFFDHISEEDYQKTLENGDFFENCDYLFYTHHHFDHFDAGRNMEYMSLKKPKLLFLPFNKRSFFEKVRKSAADNDVEFISPDFTSDDQGTICFDDFTISYYNTGHIGKENSDVPHYSFVLTLGEHKVFIAADSDYLNYERHTPLFDQDIDIAFYNPFYMSHHMGRKIINRIGAPDNYIYHLPYSKEDIAGIRHQLDRAMQKYPHEVGDLRIIPLDDPMSRII